MISAKSVQALRKVLNTNDWLSFEGISLSQREFAFYSPDIDCLILGPGQKTKSQSVPLLE
jgi:hypothetical protein